MINKKGSVWVSTVLYIGLGIIIIAIVLSAGMPVVNKIKDQNALTQTQKLLTDFDYYMKKVINEGPGSKRFISPFEINRGVLVISNAEKKIVWKMETKNLLMQPNSRDESGKINFTEGSINKWMDETIEEGRYDLFLELNYPNVRIELSPALQEFSGRYSVSIENLGYDEYGDVIVSLKFI